MSHGVGVFLFCPANNGSDCGGAAFISLCKHAGGNPVAVCFHDSGPFFRTQRLAAERGGLLHDVWNLRTVDDMKYQGTIWLDNYFGD